MLETLKATYTKRFDQYRKNRVSMGMSIEMIREESFLNGLSYAIKELENGGTDQRVEVEECQQVSA